MDTVRVGDFPSFTNEENFSREAMAALPHVPISKAEYDGTILVTGTDYEDNKEILDNLIRENGGRIMDTSDSSF